MEAKPYKIPHPYRKLSKELIDKIVEDIALGSTHKLAAQSHGITEGIFNIWRKQGIVDIEHDNFDSLPAYLVVSLSVVKKKEVIECRQKIRDSEKGHYGAQWTLERAYWQDFSRNAPEIELNERMERLENSELEHIDSEDA